MSLYGHLVPTMDKQGTAAHLADLCVHTDVLLRAEENVQFKAFLIEVAIGFVDCRFELELSRGTCPSFPLSFLPGLLRA